MLVHGWPESWYSWRHQIAALAEAGYRVAAPDVRGYGGSDKPAAIEARRTSDALADGEVVWSWRPDAGAKFWLCRVSPTGL